MSKSTKYKSVYQDTKGKYYYLAFLGRDENGKKITKKSRKNSEGKTFRNAHEAYIELIKVKNEYYETIGRANYRITYGSFMTNRFLPKYKGDVERSTYESHKPSFDIIISRFGSMKLKDIKVEDCEEFRTWLKNNGKYSSSYAGLIYVAFRQSLNYAVKLGLISDNASLKTKAIPKSKAVVEFWNKEEFQLVLATFYIDDFYEHMSFIMIWLYYMTGIRVSEGLALKWSNVDFRHKKLQIFHTLDMKNQSDFNIKPYTKTASGKRTLSLDDDTIGYLREWKKCQSDNGITEFVMSYNDLPLYRSTVSRIIKRHAKLAGVKPIQAKGLRHSHVSYLINEFNADVLTVSRRLGHSSPEITLKHYAHLWNRNDDGLAEQMNNNISFVKTDKDLVDFNGNQAVKLTRDSLPKVFQSA